ncbi:MAG: helix-turn-helix domain-containing protein [Deltaproteobacteria bacterium]|nr:helix-turn-helix domain-containing protein [Deltaproteobacteria bacterium]
MKPLEKQNYYEILEISPNATQFEIRSAYKTALYIYDNGSPVSYSFFSKDERKNILVLLEEAFLTLINDQTRSEYNRKLVEEGVLDEETLYGDDYKKPIPIIDLKRSKVSTSRKTTSGSIESGRESHHIMSKLLALDVITGSDLRKMRMLLGVPLEHIAEYTKVRINLLRCIEEDRFEELPSMFHLKSFLRSYIDYFKLDPGPFVDRYMKRIID